MCVLSLILRDRTNETWIVRKLVNTSSFQVMCASDSFPIILGSPPYFVVHSLLYAEPGVGTYLLTTLAGSGRNDGRGADSELTPLQWLSAMQMILLAIHVWYR